MTVPNDLLARAAAPVADVVLNGEGGDPCFGGPKNLPMLLARLYGPLYEQMVEAPLSPLLATGRIGHPCSD